MTVAAELYHRAGQLGLRLESAGDKLAVIPGGRCPPDFAKTLLQHKAEVLSWLNNSPCPGWQAVPPDDLPLRATLPEPSPQNRERIIAYLRRQTGDRPGPLTAWLEGREVAYFAGPGAKWDCGLLAYAAARDAACWQLARAEDKVIELMTTTGQVAAKAGKKKKQKEP